MGNLITDALVEMNRKQPDEAKWADVSIAVWNGGGIRSSIDLKLNGKTFWGGLFFCDQLWLSYYISGYAAEALG